MYIQTIFSFDTINDDQMETKFNEIRQIPSSSSGKQTNNPDCLLKNQLSKILNRDRRASISRPYFNHWRHTRDNRRYSVKNSLAFSPRLGKRADEDKNELSHLDQKFVYRSIDLDTFLVTFTDHLQQKQIDIIYEDSKQICLSQPISNAFIQQVLEKIDTNRRNQEEQAKEEMRGRQTIGKHPVLFRYRLG